MQPTYKNNQILLAKKNKHIKRNDVIIFNKENKIMIKRVIGIPEDLVELKSGGVYINKIRIYPFNYDDDEIKTIKLNKNEFFVIGDNYLNSIDSRIYGVIYFENIIGKIN